MTEALIKEKKKYFPGLSQFLEQSLSKNSAQRDLLLNEVISSIKDSGHPIYEDETTAVLIFSSRAESVSMIGDNTDWIEKIPFTKIGTDFFFLKLKLEPDARVQYQLIVDGNLICDPLNKYKSLHGLGEMSELAMPGYQRHPYLDKFLYGEQGKFDGLFRHVLKPGALPYEHEIYVSLPEEYSTDKSYPVIYFNDGPDYIRFGAAPHSINLLAKENIIPPVIAVFITPPNLHIAAIPNRSTEYGMNDNYVKFVCNEVVPFIENNYQAINSPQNRIIIGDSYGGLISAYIAFSRSDVFAGAYSQSGYFSFNNDKLISQIKNENKKPISLYVDIGIYERKVGADFLPASELDFVSANRRMKDVLESRGYHFVYREYNEGHTWGSWRRHLIDALIYFFGKEESS